MKERMSKEARKLLQDHNNLIRKHQLENGIKESFTRARGVAVGTAFGGTVEISLRGEGGSHMWAVLQPVEAVEILHQLAAAVGCHLHLTPRRDFAAWRNWKNSPEELEHFRGGETRPGVGHPPHAKALVESGYDTSLPPPEEQPGLPPQEKEAKDEEAMAAKKAE